MSADYVLAPVREFVVRDWTWRNLLRTGSVRCVGMRPQRIAASEPYCLTCDKVAFPCRVMGRWDVERGATALPFDPVWVRMTCGCEFGDDSLASPRKTPGERQDGAS